MKKFFILSVALLLSLFSCKKETVQITYKYALHNQTSATVEILMFSSHDTLHHAYIAPADSLLFVFRQCNACDLEYFLQSTDSTYIIIPPDTVKHYAATVNGNPTDLYIPASWQEGPSNAYYKYYYYTIQ